MIKTKLIFVDGISGSGKSTISHYIARQLNKNGIKAQWYHETDQDNPFSFRPEMKNYQDNKEYMKLYFSLYLKQISDLVKKIKRSNKIIIIDSFLFQDILNPLLYCDPGRKRIYSFYKKYLELFNDLDPVVIHFCQDDVKKHIHNNFENRGEGWKQNRIRAKEEFEFCKNRNYKGEIAYIELFSEMSDISKTVFKKIKFRKVQIENSEKKWSRYRKQIIDFLDVKPVKEDLYQDNFNEFCGQYKEFKIHIKNRRLVLDHYWPDQKLLMVKKDVFELEGMPVEIKFIRDNNNKVISMRNTYMHVNRRSGHYLEKKDIKVSNKTTSKRFCGKYYCRPHKASCEIMFVDDKFVMQISEKDKRNFIYDNNNTLRSKFSAITLNFNFSKNKRSFIYKFSQNNKYKFVEK